MHAFDNTYTLVELSVSSQCHPGLVSAIHSVDVVSFDLFNLVHCYIASKGYLTKMEVKENCHGF